MNSAIIRRAVLRAAASLWFRPAIYALVAISVLGLAPLMTPILPDQIVEMIGLDGVYDLLDVLANTLLAVAIFSLGIMASSMQAAAQAATPRARPLLMKDRTAQNAISTFIGGFIFAVVGIVGLSTDYYGDASRVILFFATCLVILSVIVALIRWIGRLSNLGDVANVVDVVEEAAANAFVQHARQPDFGGHPLKGPVHDHEIMPDGFGFVRTIDAGKLQELAEEIGITLHILVRPGSHVDPARPLAASERPLPEEDACRLREAFEIGGDRSFEQDPRFALIVLSEIGSRALSTGVNDPGTAIDVVGTASRVLAGWRSKLREAEPDLCRPRLHVLPLEASDVMEDAFRWIARDGAAQLEVQIRIQKALATLAAHDPDLSEAALAMSDEALERAKAALDLPQDRDRLARAAARVGTAAKM